MTRRQSFRTVILYKNSAILEEPVRMVIKMPIDCADVLNDIFIRLGVTDSFNPSDEDKRVMFEMLKTFLRDIPYVYTNERQR